MKLKRTHYIQAMEILERDGWCKGALTDLDGRHCVRGAMREAAKNWGPNFPSCAPVGLTLLPEMWFNDNPYTTYEDVLTFLAFGAAGAWE
jgi:hypothetical protein